MFSEQLESLNIKESVSNSLYTSSESIKKQSRKIISR